MSDRGEARRRRPQAREQGGDFFRPLQAATARERVRVGDEALGRDQRLRVGFDFSPSRASARSVSCNRFCASPKSAAAAAASESIAASASSSRRIAAKRAAAPPSVSNSARALAQAASKSSARARRVKAALASLHRGGEKSSAFDRRDFFFDLAQARFVFLLRRRRDRARAIPPATASGGDGFSLVARGGEIVDQIALRGGEQKRVMRALAANFDNLADDLAQLPDRRRASVDESARFAVGGDDAANDERLARGFGIAKSGGGETRARVRADGISNTASTSAAPPSRARSGRARPPRKSDSASTSNDLPAPVSPVSATKPDENPCAANRSARNRAPTAIRASPSRPSRVCGAKFRNNRSCADGKPACVSDAAAP